MVSLRFAFGLHSGRQSADGDKNGDRDVGFLDAPYVDGRIMELLARLQHDIVVGVDLHVAAIGHLNNEGAIVGDASGYAYRLRADLSEIVYGHLYNLAANYMSHGNCPFIH